LNPGRFVAWPVARPGGDERGGGTVPITNTDTDTLAVRSSGKRFYIIKDDDQAVVRTVPVGVCAAPPRIALQQGANEDGAHGPTCPAPVPPHVIARHGLAERVQRVRDAVRHPISGRGGR
jgi:hypothetical protein